MYYVINWSLYKDEYSLETYKHISRENFNMQSVLRRYKR